MFKPEDWHGWSFRPAMPREVVTSRFVGLDLGQQQDPSALAVIEKTVIGDEKPRYACRHLERYQLGTSYPAIVEAVVKLLTAPTARGTTSPLADTALVVDATGVGRPVVDLFRLDSTVESLVPVVITGGLAANYGDDGTLHVPKKELVSVLQVLLQSRRLTVAKGLALADVLIKELLTFKVKLTAAGNESFEAWRERDHDDLVLAVAIALWYADRDPGPADLPLDPFIGGRKVRP